MYWLKDVNVGTWPHLATGPCALAHGPGLAVAHDLHSGARLFTGTQAYTPAYGHIMAQRQILPAWPMAQAKPYVLANSHATRHLYVGALSDLGT